MTETAEHIVARQIANLTMPGVHRIRFSTGRTVLLGEQQLEKSVPNWKEVPVSHRHITVIGRVPGDDDDNTIHSFQNLTQEEAKAAFLEEVRETRGDDIEAAKARYGEEIYITHVLVSNTPIESL